MVSDCAACAVLACEFAADPKSAAVATPRPNRNAGFVDFFIRMLSYARKARFVNKSNLLFVWSPNPPTELIYCCRSCICAAARSWDGSGASGPAFGVSPWHGLQEAPGKLCVGVVGTTCNVLVSKDLSTWVVPPWIGEIDTTRLALASSPGFAYADSQRGFGAVTDNMTTDFRIVSGGQTGADRAALDYAIAHGIPYGGWCPKGRRAEDGSIDWRYELKETPSSDYAQRTEWNVRDSDGTVIFSFGAKLTGGSKRTAELAQKLRKPCLHLSAQLHGDKAPEALKEFIERHHIKTLNVAGPRASKEPMVGEVVKAVLGALPEVK